MSANTTKSTVYGCTLEVYGDPATEARVTAFERQLGTPLPDDYRSFLLLYNGGKPTPSGFRLRRRSGPYTDSLVQSLDALHDARLCNLERRVDRLRNRMPREVISIGCDPGGNSICLGISGDRRGQIWFWDHEREPEVPDWSNLDLVAPSFDAFMRGLSPTD
jgi:hypothetical protein